MIILEKISKIYRTGFWYRKVPAAEEVTFHVKKGEVFGFIGANGAGKTTIIKVILGLVPPNSGKGSLMGYPIGDPNGRAHVGFLPENPYFPENLRIGDFMYLAAKMKKIPKDRILAEIEAKLSKTKMAGNENLRFEECSKGMIQRTGLAYALLGNPQLLILDEPMSGLDPQGRAEVQAMIRREREKGHTVFFSSHIMSDIEQVCDRVAIMAEGKLRGVFPAGEFFTESEDDLLGVVLRKTEKINLQKLSELDPNLNSKGEDIYMNIKGQNAVVKLFETIEEDYSAVVSIQPHKRGLERHFYKSSGENKPLE